MVLRITPMERTALRLMAVGKATREIARDLGLSERVVEDHLSSLFQRMGAASRSEAIGAAVRRGLVEQS
ncbi:MAG TPA: LuxR C-terminal-related transcriptional regulator [Vicinamibacterales bacterium]